MLPDNSMLSNNMLSDNTMLSDNLLMLSNSIGIVFYGPQIRIPYIMIVIVEAPLSEMGFHGVDARFYGILSPIYLVWYRSKPHVNTLRLLFYYISE
jgi:hypothetical protein